MRLLLPFRTVYVEEAFDITGRGVALVFPGSTAGLPFGRIIQVEVTTPQGRTFNADASAELMLRHNPDRELGAIVLNDRSKVEVPPGSSIRFLTWDAPA